jgi:signal transduction histidine kinase
MNTLSKKHLVISFPHDLQIGDWAARYGFAVLACVLAGILTRLIGPYVNHNLFDLFQGAVVVSTWYGGLGPGITTASLSIMTLDYFFIPPLNTFTLGPADLVRLLIFGVVALLTSSLSNQLKEAKSEIEKAHGELEDRIALRTQELSKMNLKLTAEVAHRLKAEKTILEISHREQRRLGQDLHDGLCQILAGVRLMCEDLSRKLAGRSLPEQKDADLIESRLSDALAQADTLSRGLYPVELEANGLMAALEEMAVKLSGVFPVACHFRCPKPAYVSDASVANHLYRIAQEAVMNAIKGGKAKRVTVRLTKSGSKILLSVTDDGIGIGNNIPRKGMGLTIMAYRARMIDATLNFYSRRSGWTRVSCSMIESPSGETNADAE